MSDERQPQGNYLIKDMVTEERPREKALRLGVKALSTTELMAIIFATGVSGKSVLQLSNEILADSGGHLSRVAKLSVNDLLKRFKGIGKAKALSLLAALELGARSEADAVTMETRVIRSPEDSYNYMKRHLSNIAHEEFWVLLLASSGKIIKEVNVARGGLSSTVVDVKIIMRQAIDNSAASMILFHNHPSGNLTPSMQDENLTKRIFEAAKLLDLRVLDHLIISDNGYYSFNDHGRMPV